MSVRSVMLAVCAAAASSFLAACTDQVSPTAPAVSTAPTVAFAKGAGGGGGGGGGGNGGGGTATPKPGQIQAASAGAVCDGGSSMSVSISKGFADRGDITIIATASPTPIGPPVPPSLFEQTSLGGLLTVSITEVDTGAFFMGFSTTMGYSTPSYRIQNLGRTVTPGSHTFSYVATTQHLAGDIETCTATITFFAK